MSIYAALSAVKSRTQVLMQSGNGFDRLQEGHVFRKLNAKDAVFIEYAPLETAWVPITGDNYYYIYCLWASGATKEKGMGNRCWSIVLRMPKKTANPVFACWEPKNKKPGFRTSHLYKFGFQVVDTTDNGYELLALDGTIPRFAQNVKKLKLKVKNWTIHYDMQCPYIYQNIEMIKQYCSQICPPCL